MPKELLKSLRDAIFESDDASEVVRATNDGLREACAIVEAALMDEGADTLIRIDVELVSRGAMLPINLNDPVLPSGRSLGLSIALLLVREFMDANRSGRELDEERGMAGRQFESELFVSFSSSAANEGA